MIITGYSGVGKTYFSENTENKSNSMGKGNYAITPPFPDHAILTADVNL